MSEFVRIDAQGGVVAEDGAARERLAQRPGRFWLAPASPDLLVAVRAPALGAPAKPPRVVLAGDLAGLPLPDLIAFLHQTRVTGLLRVVAPTGERALLLRAGEVRGAASDDPADRLGEIAVRLGMVPRADLDRVLAEGPPAARMGRALVDAGLLQAHDLWRCMQVQVSEIFFSMLLVKEGSVLLIDQEVDDRAPLALNTQGLLMDAIRRLDEMTEFRKRLPSSRAYVVRKSPPSPKMEDAERAVYELCTGQRTVAEVGQAARLSEFETTKVLHHLIETGHVAVANEPQAATAPAPSGPSAEETVRIFNGVFREIFSEVRKVGMGPEFVSAANGALANQAQKSPALAQLTFGNDGALSPAKLLQNAATLGLPPGDTSRTVHGALSELMFFLLFESGELLDPRADEALAARVKTMLVSLEAARK